jgi:DNA (cytosine-5)-methyltransferase 1
MVSILGDCYYEFPKPIKLELRVKDLLEDEVPEKYYLSKKLIDYFINNTIKQKEKGNTFTFSVTDGNSIAKSITTQSGSRMEDNFIADNLKTAQDIHGVIIGNPDIKQVGNLKDTDSYGGNPQTGRVYDPDYICPAINTMGGGQREPKFIVEDGIAICEATAKGYDIAYDGDTINLEQPNSKTRRGRVGKQIAQTINTSTEQAVVENIIPCELRKDEGIRVFDENIMGALRTINQCGDKHLIYYNQYRPDGAMIVRVYRIRKLMPIEGFRLMGFTREDFFKVKEAKISDCQTYKQAGNSIVVDVLEAIFRNMNMKGVKRWQE